MQAQFGRDVMGARRREEAQKQAGSRSIKGIYEKTNNPELQKMQAVKRAMKKGSFIPN